MLLLSCFDLRRPRASSETCGATQAPTWGYSVLVVLCSSTQQGDFGGIYCCCCCLAVQYENTWYIFAAPRIYILQGSGSSFTWRDFCLLRNVVGPTHNPDALYVPQSYDSNPEPRAEIYCLEINIYTNSYGNTHVRTTPDGNVRNSLFLCSYCNTPYISVHSD